MPVMACYNACFVFHFFGVCSHVPSCRLDDGVTDQTQLRVIRSSDQYLGPGEGWVWETLGGSAVAGI